MFVHLYIRVRIWMSIHLFFLFFRSGSRKAHASFFVNEHIGRTPPRGPSLPLATLCSLGANLTGDNLAVGQFPGQKPPGNAIRCDDRPTAHQQRSLGKIGHNSPLHWRKKPIISPFTLNNSRLYSFQRQSPRDRLTATLFPTLYHFAKEIKQTHHFL